MLQNIKTKREQGFTIIEVLIVLAIAGLIMVVVFLAVPALQRSSRNTALNTDANNILSAAGSYVANNGGQLPPAQASAAVADHKVTIGASTSNQAVTKVGSGAVSFGIITSATGVLTKTSTIGSVQLVTGSAAKCNDTNSGLSGTASGRSYVVLYVAESGSGNIVKCQGN